MAQTIDFSKETKGISITKNGVKTSFSAGVVFMGYPTGDTVARVKIHQFGDVPLADHKVNLSEDTITVNGVAFDPEVDDATNLIDDLREGVFIADVIV